MYLAELHRRATYIVGIPRGIILGVTLWGYLVEVPRGGTLPM